jgi:hypothetical protein
VMTVVLVITTFGEGARKVLMAAERATCTDTP